MRATDRHMWATEWFPKLVCPMKSGKNNNGLYNNEDKSPKV
jgi:hypothetical protein